MEDIKSFIKVKSGSGAGDGSGCGSGGCGSGDGSGSGSGGYGDGSGSGSGGYGDGSGSGSGGSGYGFGSGYGSGGSGYGFGYGCGSGCGFGGPGYGSGSGCGYGFGSGCDLRSYNGDIIYIIDGIPTIIKQIIGNLAKGYIIQQDLNLKLCYIAKSNDLFAHGTTIKEAEEALREKIFASMDSDSAIDMFLQEFQFGKKYPAKQFYIWHHRLTGSCEFGRNQFVKEHAIDLESGMYTIEEFIEITKNDYGGEIIERILERKE